MKFVFTTYDDEFMYASRIAGEIEKELEKLKLDTTNKEYVVIVEVMESG